MFLSYLLLSMPFTIMFLPISGYYCIGDGDSMPISSMLSRIEVPRGKLKAIARDATERPIERVTNRSYKPFIDNQSSGIKINTNLYAHERTQGSVRRTLAGDDSQVSVTAQVKRTQSNDVLDESNAEVVSINVIPTVQVN
ncbi:uncharacterized protein LOC141858783 [Brevipalpus obovatus]|uniref:uncharacterized protein LOC141858783 n=1 Tax=Brevipalpus obovatus TaxID=246614 RepID=UPI003D9ED217